MLGRVRSPFCSQFALELLSPLGRHIVSRGRCSACQIASRSVPSGTERAVQAPPTTDHATSGVAAHTKDRTGRSPSARNPSWRLASPASAEGCSEAFEFGPKADRRRVDHSRSVRARLRPSPVTTISHGRRLPASAIRKRPARRPSQFPLRQPANRQRRGARVSSSGACHTGLSWRRPRLRSGAKARLPRTGSSVRKGAWTWHR